MTKNDEKFLEQISDREWRLANLYKIVDKSGNRVFLRENNIQKAVRREKSKRKRILKARQFGISTGCIIDMLDRTLWTNNVTSCIIAHEQDSIQKLFRIVQRAYKFLPYKIRHFIPQVDRGGGSKYHLYFPEINSRIYCDLESRGDTIHNLHISEAAFVPKVERIKSTIEAVPLETGRITVETTPNGIGNHFYDEWSDPNSNFKNLFYPWFLHEEYKIQNHSVTSLTDDEKEMIKKAQANFGVEISLEQIAFRRFKQADLKSMFLQEYPEDDQTCFLSSGNTVMDLQAVKLHLSTAKAPISDDGIIKIYRPYDKHRHYVIGADTAEGFGIDYSTACVIECQTREQVATIRGKLKPSDFAHKIASLGKTYNQPIIAVERNNHGHAVLLELDEHLRYPNLYRHRDNKLGFLTDRITRPIMINAIIDAVDNRTVTFNDKAFLNECLTLVNDEGKIQAAPGKHDDMIFATAIALQVCIEAGPIELYKNIKRKILV
jgi:hypothetical protein